MVHHKLENKGNNWFYRKDEPDLENQFDLRGPTDKKAVVESREVCDGNQK